MLRRSLNTQLVMARVDRITTRPILGHTSETMTQRYAGIDEESKGETVARTRLKLVVAPGTTRNCSTPM